MQHQFNSYSEDVKILDERELSAVIGKRVPLRRSGNRWIGLCPFHHEKTPSFHVYKGNGDGRGRYYCFGCHASGDSIEWLRRVEGKNFFKAGGEQTPFAEQVRRDRDDMKLRRKQDVLLRRYRVRNPDCCLPDWAIEFYQGWRG